MVVLLFFILGLLVAVESSTALARKAGYAIGNPASGLIFQSSLALLSRALIFMFMPILGSMADANILLDNASSVFGYYLFLPLCLLLVYVFREKLDFVFGNLLARINEHGTYFKRAKNMYRSNSKSIYRSKKKFRSFYIIVLLAYVPYYLSWPIIIILLDMFNDSRGLILGLSSVFNGINTIAITVWIDPKLAKYGMYSNLIQQVYSNLVLVRFIASLIGLLLLIVVFFI